MGKIVQLFPETLSQLVILLIFYPNCEKNQLPDNRSVTDKSCAQEEDSKCVK